jgi:hypothetical protein
LDGFLFGSQDERWSGISGADKQIIYDNIRESIIEIAAVEIGHQHEQQQQKQPEQMLALHKKVKQQPAAEDDTFDEIIINHYIDENVPRGDAAENGDVNRNAATTADALITLYKQESTLQLRRHFETFSCLLAWWKHNEQK